MAPKFLNCQTMNQLDNAQLDLKSSSKAEPRVVKMSNLHKPGAPPARRLSTCLEKVKQTALAPLSLIFHNDEANFQQSHAETLLSTKHAWAVLTPNNDRKKNRSLPVLNGSNVTVDSPDPTSKFFKSPPIPSNPSKYSESSDSPDTVASFLAVNDIMAMTLVSPGLSGTAPKSTTPYSVLRSKYT